MLSLTIINGYFVIEFVELPQVQNTIVFNINEDCDLTRMALNQGTGN